VPPEGIVGGGVGFRHAPPSQVWFWPQHESPQSGPNMHWYWHSSAALQLTATPLAMSRHGAQLGPQLSTERASHEPSPQRRALPVHSHSPALHASSALHAVVQLPQKSSLVRVLTHIVPHIISCGPGHAGWQEPFMHAVPDSHRSLHALQFWSVLSGTHVLFGPQRSWPCGQSQTPALHIAPPEHLVPHVPQFCSSVCVSTHSPLQRSSIGAVHCGRHIPPMHVAPSGHGMPHLPQ